ncbi:shikimate dehydrogenase [Roseomonas sp. SSH11]|uniref:shikimate dehydrogenase (NADP(+)) n=1 Tax=Pararoseomonas baculiformis TaxID=2820812 RepID=A0ABS4AGL2_9PROT|nr:shikimate dehydrogenase [Pararoseomonas baculiformis]MBP0445359.1 shikimate dehydrogenase [Pararoseomonas baculiformis]
MSNPPILKRVTGRTRVMFILGDPVAHIIGTAILNEDFFRHGVDATVSPLHVAPGDLGQVVQAIRAMRNVAGFGVTIPHKIAVIPHLDRTTGRAAGIGAVNFVRREADGTLVGDNVDGIGFVAGLRRNGVEVAGRRVLQLGAGGAGRAIAFALAEAGASRIAIHNRTEDRALALARAVAAAYPACATTAAGPDSAGHDLVVNTTSLGMHEEDALPADLAGLDAGAVVADVIMAPETTPLLEAAAARGCRIIRGKEMLLDQPRLVREFLAL